MQATTFSSQCSTFHTIFKLKIEAITYTKKYQSGPLQYHTSTLGPLLFHELSRPHIVAPYPLLTTAYSLLSVVYFISSLQHSASVQPLGQLLNFHTLYSTLFNTYTTILYSSSLSMEIPSFVPLLHWAQCCICHHPHYLRVYSWNNTPFFCYISFYKLCRCIKT